jgi:lysophospholipase L1-like esterase
MYEILCYGDSNTWGSSPENGERFSRDVRWTGVLQRSLGSGHVVIEEGQGGRTTVWDDTVEGEKNGKKYLVPCLQTHAPLDLVILMLGTNDLNKRFSVSAFDIAQSVGVLLDIILGSKCGRAGCAPKTPLLAPPSLCRLTGCTEMFEGGTEKSRKLGLYFEEVAARRCSAYLDTAGVIHSRDVDGLHFDDDEHRKLGHAVARIVKQMLAD